MNWRIAAIAGVPLFCLACVERPLQSDDFGCPLSEPCADAGATPEDAAPAAGPPDGGLDPGSLDAATPSPAPPVNPFLGASFYVNGDFSTRVQAMIPSAPEEAEALALVARQGSAVWLRDIASVTQVERHLQAARAQAEIAEGQVVSMFVLYNLPDRECAFGSTGELTLAADGATRYRAEFIDPIVAAFARHPEQRITVVLEPNALPLLTTHQTQPSCAPFASRHLELLAYALRQLAMPHVWVYLDAAHEGWLGWPSNLAQLGLVTRQIADRAGGPDLLRGLATNVRNYGPLEEATELFDYGDNPCHDALSFARELRSALTSAGLPDKHVVIDTSRNGRGGIRSSWDAWCNLRGAGLGARPVASPVPGVDAYYWIRAPGDSDGSGIAPCVGPESMPNAPPADSWFPAHLLELIRNAEPSL